MNPDNNQPFCFWCAFRSKDTCPRHSTNSEEKKWKPCTCLKGGKDLDGNVCPKCKGVEYVSHPKEEKKCKCFPLNKTTCFFTDLTGEKRCDCKCHHPKEPTELEERFNKRFPYGLHALNEAGEPSYRAEDELLFFLQEELRKDRQEVIAKQTEIANARVDFAREAERKKIQERLASYFKGLLLITDPQATYQSLTEHLFPPPTNNK